MNFYKVESKDVSKVQIFFVSEERKISDIILDTQFNSRVHKIQSNLWK